MIGARIVMIKGSTTLSIEHIHTGHGPQGTHVEQQTLCLDCGHEVQMQASDPYRSLGQLTLELGADMTQPLPDETSQADDSPPDRELAMLLDGVSDPVLEAKIRKMYRIHKAHQREAIRKTLSFV